MPLTLIDSQSDIYDITDFEEVLSHEALQDRRCQIVIEAENNDVFPSGNWYLRVKIGGFVWDGGGQAKQAESNQRVTFVSLPFVVREGQTLTVEVKAPGGTTESSTVGIWLYDLESVDSQALTITIPLPGRTTGFFVAYNHAGVAEAGVVVTCTLRTLPKGTTAIVGDNTERSATSDSEGLITFSNLFKGATYTFRRGSNQKSYALTIPEDAGETYALPPVIGAP